MKRFNAYYHVTAGILVLILLMTAEPLSGQMLPAAKYEGTWEIRANGDVKVTRRFELPMQLYRMWKSSDVHMLEFRSFAAGRSNIEVADKKAEWDDMNRTLTLTMTVRGLAQNMSDHWEAKILAGEEFSNLDEAKKTVYFHFTADGQMGRIQGQDRIVLPEGCSKPAWNASNRTITYIIPAAAAKTDGDGGSSPVLWWVLFAVCALGGAGMLAASFVLKNGASAAEK